jgi:hypothetical protein
MEMDPHLLQQILSRIYQHMRCPQCNKQVPVDFSSVKMAANDNMVLQLYCEECKAHIVLNASVKGIEHLAKASTASETDPSLNASTALQGSEAEIKTLRETLAKGVSFDQLFGSSSNESQVAPEKQNS